ncbi:MAG TPA: hypothetical protein VNY27_08115 [Solirubrobacteraceae bacterium]|nr:hypothetical protein [Solirubrobacteraceae bacterium]
MGFGSPLALAETHPKIGEFGSFTNPNGIAVDESSGDVYVADLGPNTVSKFDASGVPVESWGTKGVLNGSTTSAGSFSFPNEPGNPAAVAVDNSTNPSDPSRGDLYVMDAGHNVVDKFNAAGELVHQIEGPFNGELLGLGVNASGNLWVDTRAFEPAAAVFDDSLTNRFVRSLTAPAGEFSAPGHQLAQEYGFAVGGAGPAYELMSTCHCMVKAGPRFRDLGLVDGGSPPDVAAALDPATGHLYLDDQTSVAEWDTGEMNGGKVRTSGTLVSSFGGMELEASRGQGGIAVNGASGRVYVSDPVEGAGKVLVFGVSAPAVTVGAPASVTRTGATLQGAIDPRGVPVTSCQFEYEASTAQDSNSQLTFPATEFAHSVSCAQTPQQIGAGMGLVAVFASVGELTPGVLYDFRLVAGNANGTTHTSGRFATAGPGFGIKTLEVAFVSKDGTPDTQAGSHPFAMKNDIALNTKAVPIEAGVESPYVVEPDGNARDIIVDLPPGVVGDPNASGAKCTLKELETAFGNNSGEGACPAESIVGDLEAEFGGPPGGPGPIREPVFNMVPPRGVAAQIGANFIIPKTFIDAGVEAGGQYPIRAANLGIPAIEPLVATRLKFKGVLGEGEHRKAFLTLPTACNGPLQSRIEADSYQEPGHMVEKKELTRNSAGEPVNLTGCSKLEFPPAITVTPDTTDASTASGLMVGVHVSQKAALNPDGLAESALRDTTVTLPEGVAINPSGAGGLEACSEGLAGFERFVEFNPEFEPGDHTATFRSKLPQPLLPGSNFCPDGSKIGTVQIRTPLLPNPLEGAVYLAAQNANPFGSLIAMYMFVEDPISGSLIELTGEVHLRGRGQIVTTFKNTPDLPFEDLELHFFGGERAPLTTPSRCGTYTTQAEFTPWDGNGPVIASSSFNIEHGPHGGPCPGTSLPFNPTFTGGSTNLQAGSFTPLTGTFSREDGEQQMKRLRFTLPPGLSGLLTGVKLCPEAQANAGTCGSESLIGETTVSAGVGSDPVSVEGGKVYLTEQYHGSPFGLSVVEPVKAGPFDLERDSANPSQNPACDCIVIRAKIDVNPLTSALTITTNADGEGFAIPTLIDHIPVQVKRINFATSRHGFQFNPTNCAKMAIAGTVESSEGESHAVEVPFQVTNCATLGFAPKFSAATSGKTSKAKGASLNVKLAYPKAPFGSQANIASVKVELPKQLPSRLTTLQKACTAATFAANPAHCPPASIVGHAKATTPILPVPVEGPAYFVSHGGEAFPSLIMVLQGYGVTIDLVGTTFISKAGITSSSFKSVPDVPVGTFELTLPEGKFSALTANEANLCKGTKTVRVRKLVTRRVHGHVVRVRRTVTESVAQSLLMPTAFTAQNGATFKQSTQIVVTGCSKKAKKKAKKASSSHRHGKGAVTKR